MVRNPRSQWAADLCNMSMLLYMMWLLLPAAQAALHAVTGIATVALFGVGVLMDGKTLRLRPWRFLLRVLLAGALPMALYFLLDRGGGNLAGYAAQQGMFWFPLLWCAYAREMDDDRLYRWVKPMLILLILVTTLTTIGWLIQGLLRGGKVYAYARSLGSGAPDRAAYLRELMLRNIGGYDFIYATVLLLPVTLYAVGVSHGWKRIGFAAGYGLQLVMIGLSQYTYAILFAVAVTGLELFALLLRAIFRRLRVGPSLAAAGAALCAIWFFRMPLISWAQGLAKGFGFENAAYSLTQLNTLISGGVVDGGSRLSTYSVPLQGFLASPMIGSLAGGARALGMHSELLDLLSGIGLLGTAAFSLCVWLVGRGSEKGLRASPAYAQLVLQRLLMFACLVLGTVFYSREMSLVFCLSTALVLRGWKPAPAGA